MGRRKSPANNWKEYQVIDFAEAPAHDITIQGLVFPARQIFDEGHILSAVEAGVMNQTRDENLRNNYAAKIKATMKDEKVDSVGALNKEALTQLQSNFPTFEEAYEFGSRGGAREVDPERKQAILLATDSVKKALQKKGMTLRDVGADKIRDMAQAAIEKYPKFLEKAKEIVAARTLAAAELDIDLN